MGMGEWIVLLVLAAVVLLAVRSLVRSRKRGGCGGGCAGCSGCSGCCHGAEDPLTSLSDKP